MALFLLKELSITNNFDFVGGIQDCGRQYPTCSFTLDVYPCGPFNETTANLMKSISASRYISINTDEFPVWVDQFREEFKQFLIERYPEKIISDQDQYKKVFGED